MVTSSLVKLIRHLQGDPKGLLLGAHVVADERPGGGAGGGPEGPRLVAPQAPQGLQAPRVPGQAHHQGHHHHQLPSRPTTSPRSHLPVMRSSRTHLILQPQHSHGLLMSSSHHNLIIHSKSLSQFLHLSSTICLLYLAILCQQILSGPALCKQLLHAS